MRALLIAKNDTTMKSKNIYFLKIYNVTRVYEMQLTYFDGLTLETTAVCAVCRIIMPIRYARHSRYTGLSEYFWQSRYFSQYQ